MSSLAQDALQYQGKGYTYAGAPAAGAGNWDCSSFVNWCLGHDLQHSIPGFSAGTYDGKTHGPVVLDYATWNGATTVKGPPQASDLCVWPGIGATGHIGIAVSPQTMISALNHAKGTVVTPIAGHGPAGIPVVYRRISGADGSGMSLPTGCVPGMGFIYLIMKGFILMNRFRRIITWGDWFDSRELESDEVDLVLPDPMPEPDCEPSEPWARKDNDND